jgi:hypothetical protein
MSTNTGILIGPGVIILSGDIVIELTTEDNDLLITENGNQLIEE